MKLVNLELTNVFVAIGVGIGALSVWFIISVLTNVFVTSPFRVWSKGIGALSVCFVVLELTNVFVAICIGNNAKTIVPIS